MHRVIFSQRKAINLFFIVVIILGLFSLAKLGTAELPEPPNSGLTVTAILPGASPEEMDKKVARLLQNAVKDIPGVDRVVSRARESSLSTRIRFVEDHGDKDALADEIAQIINQIPDLPAELEGPFVSRPNTKVFPAATLVLAGGDDLSRHIAWVEIEQILRSIPQVEYIETLGDRERRIEIQLDTIKLQQLGLQIAQVSQLIQKSIADRSAGRMETLLSINRLRVKANPQNVEEIRALPINIAGRSFSLSQLATVEETLSPETLRVSHQGKAAWYANVYRREGSKMEDLSVAIKQVAEVKNTQFADIGSDLSLLIVQDRNFIVEKVLGELSNAILLGMSLVLLILWCFFGFKNALYAAVGIPFSFIATFIAMDALGLHLNTFTLFGLVLVCGMIVDDSIVVLENIYRNLATSDSTVAGIVAGCREVFPAVAASTGTTIAAFLPLLLMTGGMGDFISQIPKVAILALTASLVECFIVLPVHIYSHKKGNQRLTKQNNNIFNRKMQILAEKTAVLVTRLLAYPVRVFSVFVVLLGLTTFWAVTTMDFQLFDADEVRSIRAHVTFPKDTDLPTTSTLLSFVEPKIRDIAEVDDVVTLNGWNDYNYAKENRSHLSTLEIYLKPVAFDPQVADKVSEQIEDILNELPGLEEMHVVQTMNKPPVSTPVSIFLYGNNADELEVATHNVIEQLESIPSVININNPLEDGIPELVFEVDGQMAAHYDLQPEEIGSLLHFAVTGEKIAKIDRGDEIVDVYVMLQRANDWQTNRIQHLVLDNGSVIPIDQLGTFSRKMSPDIIKRFNGNRYIAITADIDSKVLSNFKTQKEIKRLVTDELLPPGVSFEQMGDFTQTQESLASIYQSAVLSIGLIYLILAILFRSYSQPIVVLLTLPLAYIGVVWGMTLLGRDISLFGLVGIIGLIGIVVNDSLVWVSSFNHLHREKGLDYISAAAETTKKRFRPIMLTTITTVLGLLPVSLSQSAGIAGSMASTIISGLISASLLLLIFLPLFILVVARVKSFLRKIVSQYVISPLQNAGLHFGVD